MIVQDPTQPYFGQALAPVEHNSGYQPLHSSTMSCSFGINTPVSPQPTYGGGYDSSSYASPIPVSPASSATSSTRSTPSHQKSLYQYDKSFVDTYREEDAKIRSRLLLDQYVSSSNQPTEWKPEPGEYVPPGTPAPRAPAVSQPVVTSDGKTWHQHHLPRSIRGGSNKQKLAESTRKPRPLTADDIRDPDSVNGMKELHDLEREEAARRKANRMLDQAYRGVNLW